VFGQHLAIDTVVKSINSHFKSKPSKALALSFQGWTGTGKNLVARLIAESLYENRAESGFVHWFSATRHFSRPEKKRYYQVCRVYEVVIFFLFSVAHPDLFLLMRFFLVDSRVRVIIICN